MLNHILPSGYGWVVICARMKPAGQNEYHPFWSFLYLFVIVLAWSYPFRNSWWLFGFHFSQVLPRFQARIPRLAINSAACGRTKPARSLDGIKPVKLAATVPIRKASTPSAGPWNSVKNSLTCQQVMSYTTSTRPTSSMAERHILMPLTRYFQMERHTEKRVVQHRALDLDLLKDCSALLCLSRMGCKILNITQRHQSQQHSTVYNSIYSIYIYIDISIDNSSSQLVSSIKFYQVVAIFLLHYNTQSILPKF